MAGRRVWKGSVMVVAALCSISACGTDLGPCDNEAAERIVYKRGPGTATATFYLPYTEGQALMQSSCGNGGVCHSASAKGALRHGAPAGLDFDLAMRADRGRGVASLQSGHGHRNVLKWLHASWDLIDSGAMPPGEIGKAVQATAAWFRQSMLDNDPNETFEIEPHSIPAVDSAAGKELMRNWLACGAPVVGPNTALGRRGPEPIPAQWDAIYEILLADRCATCHSGRPSPVANGGLVLSGRCESYKALVGRPAFAQGVCSVFAGALVVPGDPDASLLMRKLDRELSGVMFPDTSTDPADCGNAMPLAELQLDAIDRDSIRQWILAGAPPPSGCGL